MVRERTKVFGLISIILYSLLFLFDIAALVLCIYIIRNKSQAIPEDGLGIMAGVFFIFIIALVIVFVLLMIYLIFNIIFYIKLLKNKISYGFYIANLIISAFIFVQYLQTGFYIISLSLKEGFKPFYIVVFITLFIPISSGLYSIFAISDYNRNKKQLNVV